jgi:hypothetical protein
MMPVLDWKVKAKSVESECRKSRYKIDNDVSRARKSVAMTKHNPAPPLPSSLSNSRTNPLSSLLLSLHKDIAKMPPSPPRNRSRSRSPPRKPKSSSGGGGFRWKDKGSRANDTFTRDFDDRNRDDAGPAPRRSSPPRDRDRRDRSPRRDGNRESYRARSPRREDRDRYREGGSDRRRSPRRDGARDERKEKRKEDKPKEKKEKPKVVAAPSRQEPMIIVNVNDRLGTKAAIPCLGSDPVSKYFCTFDVGLRSTDFLCRSIQGYGCSTYWSSAS